MRTVLRVCGIANLLVMAAYVPVSYGLVRIAPFGSAEPLEARALDRMVEAVAPAGSLLETVLRGTPFAGPAAFFATYAFFLLIPTIALMVVLASLARHRGSLDETLATQLFRWSAAFAMLLAFAHPVLVQDFWLSAGWGELVARGYNPYYVSLDPAITEGLPLDYLGLLMTYGPLWALVSGGVMSVTDANAIMAGLLFKAILVGAWIGSLALVRRLLRSRPVAEQCVGITIAGWLPLGPFQVAAGGHNDSVMALLVVVWLVMLERGRHLPATAALTGSVLIKYISAPLFLLDLLHTIRGRGRPWTAYLPQAALAAVLGVGILAIFFRSPAFFDSMVHMAGWHFFTPRDAITSAARLVGIEPGLGSVAGMVAAGLAIAVQLAFVALIPVGIVRYWRSPTVQQFRYAVLMVMAGLLFGVAGHLWPWFLVSALLLGALHPSAAIARWTVGVAIAAPFALLAWIVHPGLAGLTAITPPMYLFVLLWYRVAPRSWFATDAAA